MREGRKGARRWASRPSLARCAVAGPSGRLRGAVRPVAAALAALLGRNRAVGPPFAPVTREGLYWPRVNRSSH